MWVKLDVKKKNTIAVHVWVWRFRQLLLLDLPFYHHLYIQHPATTSRLLNRSFRARLTFLTMGTAVLDTKHV